MLLVLWLSDMNWQDKIDVILGIRGISRSDLARSMGTTINRIGKWWSRGTEPSMSDLWKLSSVLKISIDWLLDPKSGFLPIPGDLEDSFVTIPDGAHPSLANLAHAMPQVFLSAIKELKAINDSSSKGIRGQVNPLSYLDELTPDTLRRVREAINRALPPDDEEDRHLDRQDVEFDRERAELVLGRPETQTDQKGSRRKKGGAA